MINKLERKHMEQVIYYKVKQGIKTNDPLRELSQQDQNYIKKVMECYLELSKIDPRPEFAEWFNMPNKALPPQKERGGERNSAHSWCEGIIEKLSRAPHRRDLSPRQCEGIETLSEHIADCYSRDICPTIRFKDSSLKNMPQVPAAYNKLFKR